MIAAGVAMLAGKTFSLPMIGGRGTTDGSLGSVYGLGVFSGGASACCAPVLIGVAALAGASASFFVALVIGVAYVFGMVAPLALIAVVWDRRDWGASSLLRNRRVTLSFAWKRRTVPLTVAVSGALMVLMGVLTAALALSGRGMATSGWQVKMAAGLQHVASVVLDALSWVPGWASTLLVLIALTLLIRAGLRQRTSPPDDVRTDKHRTSTTVSTSAPEETGDHPRLERS